MSTVSLSNTSANLSGKTAVLAEADQTITGLQTFDRGTGAPFAVTLGSGRVDNLYAHTAEYSLNTNLLDGLDGSAYLKGSVLQTAAGVSTNPIAENLIGFPLPSLTPYDVVTVRIATAYSGGLAPLLLDFVILEEGGIAYPMIDLTGAAGVGDMASNYIGVFDVNIRLIGTNCHTAATGVLTSGMAQNTGKSFGRLAAPNLAVAGCIVYFRQMSGLTSASLTWTLVATLIKAS